MCAKKTGSIEDLAVVGVDIGKDTFHLVGFDRSGQVVLRKQIKRLALDATFEKLRQLDADQGAAVIAAGKAAFSATHSVLLTTAALLMGLLAVLVFLLLAQGRRAVAFQH
ncbi:hypothetical protein [Rhodovulum sulfidophilum]|uniref:hypothetical protein n=1 Tax=Rhodovulum sulfidophilum TaxID=35806 RepID=UPI0039AF337C